MSEQAKAAKWASLLVERWEQATVWAWEKVWELQREGTRVRQREEEWAAALVKMWEEELEVL